MTQNWQQAAEQLTAHSDGLSLDVRVHRAESERAVMLLVHGFGEHSGRYRRQVEHLRSRGVTAVTYDLRSHGLTDGPRGRATVSRHVRDLMAVRDVVEARFRHARNPEGGPLLRLSFGHSMGGLVALESAIRRPWRLDGLVLSSPAFVVGVGTPEPLRKAAPVVAKLVPFLPVDTIDADAISRDPDYVADYRRDPLVHSKGVPAAAAGTMLGDGEGMLSRCRHLRVPALLVHGSADTITSVDGSRRIALDAGAAVSAEPIVTYREFEDGRHELFNDLCADEVYAALDEWLDERFAASGG